jgi:hypothetical protein
VLPSGCRAYCVEYRNVDHIKKRLKMGAHGQVTAEEAQDLARKRLAEVAYGEDPAQNKKAFSALPK